MNFRLSYSRINFTVQFLIKMERSLRNETSQHNMSRRIDVTTPYGGEGCVVIEENDKQGHLIRMKR